MPAKLINRAHVKTYALQYIKDTRPGLKIDRVSQEVYEWLDDVAGTQLRGLIRSAPSAGKTLYPEIRRAKVKE